MGESRPAGEINLSSFATDLAGLLDELGDQPAVLVGHSIGGMTIQTLLRERPDLQSRIAGVVLLNTTYTNPVRTMVLSRFLRALQKPLIEPSLWLAKALHWVIWLSKWQSYVSGSAHLANRFGFGRKVTRSQLEHVTLLATRAPPAAEAAGDLAMLHWDATGALSKFHRPVLVTGGDLDIVTRLEASQTMSVDSPNGRLEVIEGANHLGPLEQAELYNRLIAAFARSTEQA